MKIEDDGVEWEASYLGDSVYALYNNDVLCLRTDSHKVTECGNQIFLDGSVLKKLKAFIEENIKGD